ncbi:condensation domain-containing protein [Amycolatopsis kentuckyensis]|uniref:condensation domain-containing protein n=1 Tax=Amycolatopsis kentuckyensis TaxID=218823 RepID=UPI000A36C47F|nr:condensation domain-containing protein [Amycolatopsis kentuckyensis]
MAPSTTTSVPVRFSGLAGAVAPMTWSQFGIWGAVKMFHPHDAYLNVSCRVEIPDGRTLDDVLAVLHDVVVRHESLRTRYFDAADGSGRQEVLRSGEYDVRLEHDPEEPLDDLLARFADRSFDVDRGLPARFAVVCFGQRPAWLLVVVSHLSIDGLARNRLHEELTARLAGDRHHGEDRPLLTPVAQARAENSPAGIRLNERTIERWRRFGDRVDVTNFPGPSAVREPRWVRVAMCSPALGAAFDRIADRAKVTSPAVFAAMSATVVSMLSGRSGSALRCMISNRFTEAEKYYIGNMAQSGAFDVEVGDAVFDEVVRRTMAASIRGYSMGRYRMEQLAEIIPPGRFDAMHNDFRDTAVARKAPLSDAEIHALRPRTVVGPPQVLHYYDDKFHVEIRNGADGPAPQLMLDRHCVPAAEPRDVLVAMEVFALAQLSGHRDVPAVEAFKLALAQATEAD